MATYTSKPTEVKSSADAIAAKFSDLSRLQEWIDKVPAEEKAKLGDVALTPDAIILKTKQVGDITLKVTERTTSRIAFTAVGSPVPMNLALNLKPLGDESTELTTSMDVDIPVFMKAMVGGTLQKAVDQFGHFMSMMA